MWFPGDLYRSTLVKSWFALFWYYIFLSDSILALENGKKWKRWERQGNTWAQLASGDPSSLSEAVQTIRSLLQPRNTILEWTNGCPLFHSTIDALEWVLFFEFLSLSFIFLSFVALWRWYSQFWISLIKNPSPEAKSFVWEQWLLKFLDIFLLYFLSRNCLYFRSD